MVKRLGRPGEIQRRAVENRVVAHVNDLGGVQEKVLPGRKDAGALRGVKRQNGFARPERDHDRYPNQNHAICQASGGLVSVR